MTRERLWIGLIVLFLAGTLTGIVGTMLYCRYEQEHRWEHGPGAQQERVTKKLAHELSLTSSQRDAIKPIVARAHLELLTLRVRHQPEVEQILTDGMKNHEEHIIAGTAGQVGRALRTASASLVHVPRFLAGCRGGAEIDGFTLSESA